MSTCRSCHAPIIWATTQAGKAIPLDAVAVPDGNIVILPSGIAVVNAEGGVRHKSHFATCPQASAHRRRP